MWFDISGESTDEKGNYTCGVPKRERSEQDGPINRFIIQIAIMCAMCVAVKYYALPIRHFINQYILPL